MSSNDIKCKYIFMFPQKNLARKGLNITNDNLSLSCHFGHPQLKSSGGGGGSSMGGSQLNLSMSSMNSSNKEWETMPEDLENDESHSQPLEVTLPNAYDGKYSWRIRFQLGYFLIHTLWVVMLWCARPGWYPRNSDYRIFKGTSAAVTGLNLWRYYIWCCEQSNRT